MSRTSVVDDISLHLTHATEDDDALYPGSFTGVNVDILLGSRSSHGKKKKTGSIHAILVNRQAIPKRGFYEAFDSHSSDMQWIGCAVMENRLGRTGLESLAGDDDTECYFMYIEKFHIDDEHKQNGSSDVGARALRLFLHHPFIKGENTIYGDWWKVSSAAYALDPMEAMTLPQRTQFQAQQDAQRAAQYPLNPTRETVMQQNEMARYFADLERADANQFLRNGFFQDPALVHSGGDSNARILVTSWGHMSQPLKTHEQALSVTFRPLPPQITGNDARILDAVKNGCSGVLFSERDVDENQLQNLVHEISSYRSAGGSILRSNALHAAVANNSLKIVTWLLEQEPAAMDSMDSTTQSTPLMVAAATAAGRFSIRGIPDSLVMDKLLASGANKGLLDQKGMTAFGRFKRSTSGYNDMMLTSAMIGGGAQVPVFNWGGIVCPGAGGASAITAPVPRYLTCRDIEIKLRPRTGPSRKIFLEVLDNSRRVLSIIQNEIARMIEKWGIMMTKKMMKTQWKESTSKQYAS
jgi:hypothetical protein